MKNFLLLAALLLGINFVKAATVEPLHHQNSSQEKLTHP